MLSPGVPVRPVTGSDIRVSESAKSLSKCNDVTVIGLTPIPPTQGETLPFNWKPILHQPASRNWLWLKSLLSGKPYEWTRYWQPQYRDAVRETFKTARFDAVWVHYPAMGMYLEDVPWPRIRVLDEHNNYLRYYGSFGRSPNPLVRLLARRNIRLLRKALPQEFAKYTHHISVAQADLDDTRTWAPERLQLLLAPNGVDLSFFRGTPPRHGLGKEILFCGSLDAAMNEDAALRLAKRIFPQVLAALPETHLTLCGRNPAPRIRQLASERIEVTGTVADVRPYYERADMCAAPFQFGGGTKLKVFESLAMRRPLVASPKAVQGIGIRPEQCLVAEDDDAFTEATLRILKSPQLRRSMSEAGYEFAAQNSWERVYGDLESAIKAGPAS